MSKIAKRRKRRNPPLLSRNEKIALGIGTGLGVIGGVYTSRQAARKLGDSVPKATLKGAAVTLVAVLATVAVIAAADS